MSPIVRIVLATLAVIGVAGCGLGPGRGTSDVSLTVTRSFGAGQVGAITVHQVPGAETVMRMHIKGAGAFLAEVMAGER